jgi:predicted flap endonuclease-1-like 5' DNA nuclease
MRHAAGEMRQKGIKKNPFKLRDFRGAKPEYVTKLATAGVRNTEQMLAKGRTRADRQKLSKLTEIPEEAILEFVKLSDLSRIDGVKNVRARLYYDAGVDTVEKMSKWDPENLRAHLEEYVKKTGFNGIPPLPKEALHTVETAKRLQRVVEF